MRSISSLASAMSISSCFHSCQIRAKRVRIRGEMFCSASSRIAGIRLRRFGPFAKVTPRSSRKTADLVDDRGAAMHQPVAYAMERLKIELVLDLQSLHRVLERWVMRRTAVINQIRGLLLERGITLRQGRRHIDEALPGILEDACAQLSGALRVLLLQLKVELDHLQIRIDEADAMINKVAGENDACRRLVAIPGTGPITATAIIAAIGNGAAFKKGRGFSAWFGIVPGEYTHWGQAKAAWD
jgi:transposase